MNRGDVCLALAPTFDGSTPKTRPMLVVQADFYNLRISKVLLAPITSNRSRQGDPAHFLIDVSTPDGMGSGLRRTRAEERECAVVTVDKRFLELFPGPNVGECLN